MSEGSPTGRESPERNRTTYQQSFYNFFGNWYDGIMRVLYRGRDEAWRRRVAGEVDGADSVLELGAGTGRTEDRDPDVDDYVSLDVSRSMLSSGEHIQHPVLGDAHTLPFADDSFENVVAVLLMSTQINHAAVLDEVERVLEPGGRVYLVDTFANQDSLGRVGDKILTLASYPVAFKLDVDIEQVAERQGYDVVDRHKPDENIRWLELVEIVTLQSE